MKEVKKNKEFLVFILCEYCGFLIVTACEFFFVNILCISFISEVHFRHLKGGWVEMRCIGMTDCKYITIKNEAGISTKISEMAHPSK